MMTSQEASSSRMIVQRIHDIVKYSNQDVSIHWKLVSEKMPSDTVRHYVATLLKEANMPTLLMGNFFIVRNENPVVYNDATIVEIRKMMVQIARRLFDIIRYRTSNESKWFAVDWSDLLDNGEVVPMELQNHVINGLISNGIPAKEHEGTLYICADNSSLDNPFFQSQTSLLADPQTRG
jgi:hypothetical protein